MNAGQGRRKEETRAVVAITDFDIIKDDLHVHASDQGKGLYLRHAKRLVRLTESNQELHHCESAPLRPRRRGLTRTEKGMGMRRAMSDPLARQFSGGNECGLGSGALERQYSCRPVAKAGPELCEMGGIEGPWETKTARRESIAKWPSANDGATLRRCMFSGWCIEQFSCLTQYSSTGGGFRHTV